MPYITVNPTSYSVTGDSVDISYTTDKTLTDVELTKDNYNYIGSSSFTQSKAIFNISNWANGNYNSCRLRAWYDDSSATIPVTSVSLNKTNHSFTTLNSTTQLTPTVLPSNATNKNVSWNSSNTNIATVSSNGLVTSKANGSCTITVTTQDGNKTASCSISVSAVINVPVTSVSLNKNTLSLNVGETETLTATVLPSNATNKNITWTSSNTNVATVSNGLVTTKANGNCTITCTTQDGNKTATCSITVNSIPVENYVTLSPTDYEISNDTLTVYYTTNVTAKGVKLNIDGSTSNFPYTAISFTQTSATFNLSSVSDGDYDIRIQVVY